jgi:hypothetical protein
MRSTRSKGISGMVEAVRGEGRIGRAGLVSILKDLSRETESGIGAPLLLKGEPPLFRLILKNGRIKYVPCSWEHLAASWPQILLSHQFKSWGDAEMVRSVYAWRDYAYRSSIVVGDIKKSWPAAFVSYVGSSGS